MRHEQFEHQNVANATENERLLQNVAKCCGNGSFQRQNAANSKGNGQDRRLRKQNGNKTIRGPISSKRQDEINEHGGGGHLIVSELFEPQQGEWHLLWRILHICVSRQ